MAYSLFEKFELDRRDIYSVHHLYPERYKLDSFTTPLVLEVWKWAFEEGIRVFSDVEYKSFTVNGSLEDANRLDDKISSLRDSGRAVFPTNDDFVASLPKNVGGVVSMRQISNTSNTSVTLAGAMVWKWLSEYTSGEVWVESVRDTSRITFSSREEAISFKLWVAGFTDALEDGKTFEELPKLDNSMKNSWMRDI